MCVLCVCVHVCVRVCVCLCVFVPVRVYVCVCLHTPAQSLITFVCASVSEQVLHVFVCLCVLCAYTCASERVLEHSLRVYYVCVCVCF